MTTRFIVFICILAVITGTITTFLLHKTQTENVSSHTSGKNSILAECTTHTRGHAHYHAQLTITIFSKNFPIPANTGIDNNCMHPLHTHDTSGLIHIDYTKPYPFTIGNFFTIWGMIFNQYQLGNLLTGQRYTLQMRVNKKDNVQFEKYVIKDHDTIEIVVDNKK